MFNAFAIMPGYIDADYYMLSRVVLEKFFVPL